MQKKSVAVVAALIRNEEDKILICQRPAHKARGLLWEFVGGKIEKGESDQAALIRECREELDITLLVGDKFAVVRHEYSDIEVELRLYDATVIEGEPKMLEHADIRWVSKGELGDYDFCPADEPIIKMLMKK